MRILVGSGIIVIALFADADGHAHAQGWCAFSPSRASQMDCGYSSHDDCQKSVRRAGVVCVPDPASARATSQRKVTSASRRSSLVEKNPRRWAFCGYRSTDDAGPNALGCRSDEAVAQKFTPFADLWRICAAIAADRHVHRAADHSTIFDPTPAAIIGQQKSGDLRVLTPRQTKTIGIHSGLPVGKGELQRERVRKPFYGSKPWRCVPEIGSGACV